MTSKKLSRRDWLGLRFAKKSASRRENELNSRHHLAAHGLTPIAAPPSFDNLEPSQFPQLREAMLTTDQVEELFSDIQQFATDVTFVRKLSVGKNQRTTGADSTAQLSSVKVSLLTGKLARLQIRYRWQSETWIDTLERQGSNFRLVRIAHNQR
jgi:hypothetical protein